MRIPAVVVVAVLLIYRAAFSAGGEFARTVANNVSSPGKAPQGMVWIPGGEFSIGAAADGGGSCEMPMASNDAEPIHRVRVHRGGSFLCNSQYCSRYIVGTRGKGEVNTGTNHLGFRCVKSAPEATTHLTAGSGTTQ